MPARFIRRERARNRFPNTMTIGCVASRSFRKLHISQVAAQPAVGLRAFRARQQMLFRSAVVILGISVRDQFLFTQMLHIFTLKIANRRRSFCTARNTACFAALGSIPSAVAICSLVQ